MIQVNEEAGDVPVDEGGTELHGQALGKVEGAWFPAFCGGDEIFRSLEQLAVRRGDGAGCVVASDEKGRHGDTVGGKP